MKINKNLCKKLDVLEHEKESLVTKLSESHALLDSLKSEITVLVENNQSLENELKGSKELSHRLSSDNLKDLFCFLKHVSNKPSMNLTTWLPLLRMLLILILERLCLLSL